MKDYGVTSMIEVCTENGADKDYLLLKSYLVALD